GERERSLVEAAHREARAPLEDQPLPPAEAATIHHSELAEAKPGDTLSQEWNLYRREVAQLLAEGHEGKFVLIKNDAIIGIFAGEDAAFAHGYKAFMREAFLVHQIRERE